MSERIYMECRARASSIWPLGTLMKTTCIDSEDIKEFLEFYEGYDPTMQWVFKDFTGMNKHAILNFKNSVHLEWVKNKKFSLKRKT